jgi:hydroxymethylpyrimidine/phosphomethylpyrimidine kinase
VADNPRTTPGVKVALTIAGSDSSGGAGIQADLKTFSVMRVYGATAITAITSQNTTGVKHAMVLEPAVIEKQIDAVAGDIQVHATKTGMLANAAIVRAVATAVRRLNLQPLVVDPVMVAKSGDSLIDDRAVKILSEQLLPLAAIVTPNRLEAARLLGLSSPIDDPAKAGGAAEKICKTFGVRACIIKGFFKEGVSNGDGEAIDIFYGGSSVHEVAAPSRQTKNTHGAGCVFAAAIAAGLALEQPLDHAVATAKRLISEAIRQTADIGQGRGPVNALAWLDVK